MYAYLSKVANTPEKRQFLHISCTAFDDYEELPDDFSDVDRFLDELHELKALELHHSIFQPDDIRLLLFTVNQSFSFGHYFSGFRSDPERSREFNSKENDLARSDSHN